MSINEMLQWWNLIYIVPLGVSLVWILATILGGAHDGDGSHSGHGIGHDASHGMDHAAHGLGHVAHDVGQVIGHAVHGDASHGNGAHPQAGHASGHDAQGHSHDAQTHDASRDDNFGNRIMNILGLGQIPITLLIGIFMLTWGAFGMITNRFLEGIMKFPLIYIWPSLGITFITSLFFTRIMTAVVARIMPQTETYGISRLELVGSFGHTIYPVSEKAGTVDIKDTYGTVHRVQAKTESSDETISSGQEVLIIDFDEEDKRFIVRINTL